MPSIGSLCSVAGLAPLLCFHKVQNQPCWVTPRRGDDLGAHVRHCAFATPCIVEVSQGADPWNSRSHVERQKRPARIPSWTTATSEEVSEIDASLLELGQHRNEHEHSRFWGAGSSISKPRGHNEDAFFVDVGALGVADGVASMSEYADHGMNSAAYAAEILELARCALQPGGEGRDAADALRLAEGRATSFGASTAVVAHLEGTRLQVANLGDSGFMLLRGGEASFQVVARSEAQQHEWNYPYQLTRLPPKLASQLPADCRLDTAADCEVHDIIVCHRDLLLLFTDGLSDNLYDREILKLLKQSGEMDGSLVDPARIAEILSERAELRTLVRTGRTPFADASAQHGSEWSGGKQDDITVVAAWIQLSGQ